MNTAATHTAVEPKAESPLVISAVSALEKDVRWQQASEAQREVLMRIAAQRDRMAAARRANLQAQGVQKPLMAVPADAPLPERLAAFAKLHPVATAAVAGIAIMIGPRKLIRYGGLAWPLINKFKR